MSTQSDIADASHRTAQLAEAERQVVEAAVEYCHHLNYDLRKVLRDAVARLEKLRETK